MANEKTPLKMDRGPSSLEAFDGLVVKQTKKGLLQELMGCEALNEFEIYPGGEKEDTRRASQVMYSLEESSCLCRYCCFNARSFTQTVWMGDVDAQNDVVLKMERPWACPLSSGCCCIPFWPFMQAINFTGADDAPLGRTTVLCYMNPCIPRFHIEDPGGAVEYKVQYPTCLGGLCPDCCAEDMPRVGLYVYPANATTFDKHSNVGKIVKRWRGFLTEYLTDADTFAVDFPKGSTAAQKARLLGTVMYINMMLFEKNGQNGGNYDDHSSRSNNDE